MKRREARPGPRGCSLAWLVPPLPRLGDSEGSGDGLPGGRAALAPAPRWLVSLGEV